MSLALEVAEESVAGLHPPNQDRLSNFASAFGRIALVADGMGGHQGGAVASAMVVDRLPGLLERLPHQLAPDQALGQALEGLSRLVWQTGCSDADKKGMGSTVAAVLIREEPARVVAITAHVGDSRVYFLRGDQLFCLTRDHTVVQGMVDGGLLLPEQARVHPRNHVLTRVLGQMDDLEVELGAWMLLQPGDLFLLSSDGLHGSVSNEAIREILLAGGTAQELTRALIEAAMAAGSSDNISASVLRMNAEPDAGVS